MWVLKPDYLEASKKIGKWANEEDYEWCEVDPKSRIDGASIRHWRKEGGTAFVGARYQFRYTVM